MRNKTEAFFIGCFVGVLTFLVILVLQGYFQSKPNKGVYRFNNPPPPPVVNTFYPDDLVWHKYLKRAGIVTRTHLDDKQVSVIPVMVKGDQITSIRQSDEIVEHWTTALIFKTDKENYILLSKLKKENK